MSRHKSWLIVIVVAATVWAVSATLNHAQSAAGPAGGTKVGVVDLFRVFNEFQQTQVLNDKLQQYKAELAQERDRRMQEIKDAQAALDAFDPNSADFYSRRQEIKKKQLDFRVWAGWKQESLDEEYVRWVKQTYKMEIDEISSVAQRKGIQLVITREEVDTTVSDPKLLLQQILNRKVVYSDSTVDLTEEVLANLNAKFAKAGGAASIKFGE